MYKTMICTHIVLPDIKPVRSPLDLLVDFDKQESIRKNKDYYTNGGGI